MVLYNANIKFPDNIEAFEKPDGLFKIVHNNLLPIKNIKDVKKFKCIHLTKTGKNKLFKYDDNESYVYESTLKQQKESFISLILFEIYKDDNSKITILVDYNKYSKKNNVKYPENDILFTNERFGVTRKVTDIAYSNIDLETTEELNITENEDGTYHCALTSKRKPCSKTELNLNVMKSIVVRYEIHNKGKTKNFINLKDAKFEFNNGTIFKVIKFHIGKRKYKKLFLEIKSSNKIEYCNSKKETYPVTIKNINNKDVSHISMQNKT